MAAHSPARDGEDSRNLRVIIDFGHMARLAGAPRGIVAVQPFQIWHLLRKLTGHAPGNGSTGLRDQRVTGSTRSADRIWSPAFGSNPPLELRMIRIRPPVTANGPYSG